MTIKCYKCNKEFEAKRTSAKYCSDHCRKLAFQKNIVSVLESKSVAELEKEGYWIPNWKRHGYKRKAVDTMMLDIISQFPSCKWMFKGYTIEQ